MNKKLEDTFYDLLSAKLSGDAKAQDLAQLHHILEQHPQFQFLYDEVMRPPQKADEATCHTQQVYAAHYAKMMYAGLEATKNTEVKNIVPAKVKRFPYRILAAACALAILIGIALFFKESSIKPNNSNSKNEMVTTKGSKSNITLPDGTKVTLNADSRITYEENFAKQIREVTLTGEGYFDVKHDVTRPFIIHTRKADIKVLGTAFNVKNYPDGAFETSLIRGKIEITLNGRNGKKYILNPAQKFVIADTSLLHPVKKSSYTAISTIAPQVQVMSITLKDSVIAETSWMSNKLVFVNKPLREIAADLERFYNIQVTFKTAYAMGYRYTGVFENQELDEVMRILKLSKNIDYKIKNKELVIE